MKVFFSFLYQVISCLHDAFFQNAIYFENAIQTFSSNNISLKLLSNHTYVVNSIITFSDLDVLNGTIIVNVSNRFGSQTASFKITKGIHYRRICISIINFGIVYIIDDIDVHHTCDKDVTTVITTLIRSIAVSSLVISTSGDHHFIRITFIHSGKQLYLICTHQYNNSNNSFLFVHICIIIYCYSLTVSSVPPPKPNTSTPAYIIYIVIGLVLFVAGFLAGMFVICIIVLHFKLQKRKPVLDVIPLSGKFITCSSIVLFFILYNIL